MNVKITSIFNASPERVWQEVSTSRLLLYVASPILEFVPIGNEPLPAIWSPGEYMVQMKLLGIVPLGKQAIAISFPTPPEAGKHYSVLDDGKGQIASTWRHLITIEDSGDGRTLYTDEVTVKAGVLTVFIWVFANFFYRHRQNRWKRLIQNNFNYEK